MYQRVCKICGKMFIGARQAKTCSDKCRKTLSRRKQDAEAQAYDIGKKIDKLRQGYLAGAIDHELMRAILGYIERRLAPIQSRVERERLEKLLEKSK